jgi:hypothetical protein
VSSPSPPHGPHATRPEASLRARFRRLADKWKEQSRFLSNMAQLAMLKPYQRIIGLGLPAVPFILEELERDPAVRLVVEHDSTPRVHFAWIHREIAAPQLGRGEENAATSDSH